MKYLLLAVLTLTACMPRYTFERAPLPRATDSNAARCYQAKRFALVAGHGTWIKQYGSGRYIVTETWGSDGVAIYRGDDKLTPTTALPALSDGGLARAYADDHARTESDAIWYPRWLKLSLGLAFSGLAMAGGALALAVDDPSNAGRVLPLAYGGAGVALLSIIPAILAGKTYDGAIQHHLQGQMFTRREWGKNLVDAVGVANQRVADECQYEVADVPITQQARNLIGPSR